jgi:hypothetical protein
MFIDGLTSEDVKILDTIWAIDSVEDLDRYLSTLDSATLQKTLVLIEMCQLAETDDIVNAMSEYTEAETMLKGIMT